MVNIFCGALLGSFLGIFLGCALIAGIIENEMDKIAKKTMRNCILNYTIIEYED